MVTYGMEPVACLLLCGLDKLAHDHWAEVMTGPFDPDWEEVKKAEDDGRMRWFTARVNNQLVGYASVLLTRDMRNKGNMNAVIHDFFVTKKARKTGAGIGLPRFVLENIRSMGAFTILIGEPAGKDLSPLYRRLGFRPCETIWEQEST